MANPSDSDEDQSASTPTPPTASLADYESSVMASVPFGQLGVATESIDSPSQHNLLSEKK